MRTILHILTKPEDELVKHVFDAQRLNAETKIEVVRLQDGADYNALLDQIFSSDSIEVW